MWFSKQNFKIQHINEKKWGLWLTTKSNLPFEGIQILQNQSTYHLLQFIIIYALQHKKKTFFGNKKGGGVICTPIVIGIVHI